MNGEAQGPFRLDRAALARAFSRAGVRYDEVAQLQSHVRAELLSRLQYFALQPRSILDLGAGTCQASLALRDRYSRARVFALDLAPGMLAAAPRGFWPRRRFERICADANALPLSAHSIDLVFSSLMLQWCDEPQRVFGEIARVLKPGGLLLFSSFGPETLHELRDAWAAADAHAHAHVSVFLDMPQLGEALLHAGLSEPVMDIEQQCRHYPDVQALMHELRTLGARNAARDRPRGLTSRGQLQRMLAAYEPHRGAHGVPATFEIIYGAAFAPRAALPPAAAGEVAVPVSAVRRSRR